MGNRAVIQPEGQKFGIYVHWNGGPESVVAFLKVAKDLGVRDPVSDPYYFAARLTQIISNYFGGALSVAIGDIDSLDTDNGDNGTYIVGADFKIVRREHAGRPAPGSFKMNRAVYDECKAVNAPLFRRGAEEGLR